jgi:hypothetical protein
VATEAQNKAKQRYNKKVYQRFEVRLRKVEDKELIDYLETKASKNDYLKQLIIKDYQSK